MQEIEVIYGGGETRMLRYVSQKPVSVSGDANSTQLMFKIPESYDGYAKYIEYDIKVKGAEGTRVSPFYPLVYDTSTESYNHVIPEEITSETQGAFIAFYLKLLSDDIVEYSLPLGIFINKGVSQWDADPVYIECRDLIEAEGAVRAAEDHRLRKLIDAFLPEGGIEEVIEAGPGIDIEKNTISVKEGYVEEFTTPLSEEISAHDTSIQTMQGQINEIIQLLNGEY